MLALLLRDPNAETRFEIDGEMNFRVEHDCDSHGSMAHQKRWMSSICVNYFCQRAHV
jgi:hypothetical protein